MENALKPSGMERFFYWIYETAQKKYIFWPVISLALIIVAFHYFFVLGVNFSKSLPNTYFIFERHFDPAELKVGDTILMRYTGNNFFPSGTHFVKIIGGVAGDKITHIGQDVYVNGRHIGTAKLFSGYEQEGVPLEIGPEGVIPDGYYFVYTPYDHSFDSRYKYVGLIDSYNILGKSYFSWGQGPEMLEEKYKHSESKSENHG